MLTVQEYTGEKKVLVALEEELQDFLVQKDSLHFLRRLPKFGELYIEELLEKVQSQNGKCYIAKYQKIPVGMIVGIIQETAENELLGTVYSKYGIVLELMVKEKFRDLAS